MDDLRVPGVGMTWRAAFNFRGKKRELELEMVTLDRPNEMVLESMSPGLIGQMSFEMMALARNRTRLLVQLELKPLTLSARLLVQSFKLAKTSLTRKYKARVADYAKGMEERYARGG
ncbi:SRPBCC family protein [Sulfitobacter aestuariivivens]